MCTNVYVNVLIYRYIFDFNIRYIIIILWCIIFTFTLCHKSRTSFKKIKLIFVFFLNITLLSVKRVHSWYILLLEIPSSENQYNHNGITVKRAVYVIKNIVPTYGVLIISHQLYVGLIDLKPLRLTIHVHIVYNILIFIDVIYYVGIDDKIISYSIFFTWKRRGFSLCNPFGFAAASSNNKYIYIFYNVPLSRYLHSNN